MAEFKKKLSTEKLKAFLDKLLISCEIAIDKYYVNEKYEILSPENLTEITDANNFQLFIKHTSFSRKKFQMMKINNISMGEIYVISRHKGDGHLQLIGFRSLDNTWDTSIGYVSFFDDIDKSGKKPSRELKLYYHKIVKIMRML